MTSNEQQESTEQATAQTTEQEAPAPTTRIHVTNLPWSYTDEQLSELFSKTGKVTKASIVTRTNGESKGFGFVEYATAEGSQKAIEELNNLPVEKRRIGVVFSTSEGPYTPTAPRDFEDGEPSTRLHVRQLQWAVKRKDLQDAFGKFGKLTSCQLVKNKKSGRPRGYGFVEFENEEDAKKAKEALNKSKLMDREIVVLFSKSTGPRKTKQRRKKVNKPKKEEEKDKKPVEENKNEGGKKKTGKNKNKKRNSKKKKNTTQKKKKKKKKTKKNTKTKKKKKKEKKKIKPKQKQ